MIDINFTKKTSLHPYHGNVETTNENLHNPNYVMSRAAPDYVDITCSTTTTMLTSSRAHESDYAEVNDDTNTCSFVKITN